MVRENGQSFEKESTNPRLRRAFAFTKLHDLREGNTTLVETVDAILAARGTIKGRRSGFEGQLVRSVPPEQRTLAIRAVESRVPRYGKEERWNRSSRRN